MKEGKRHIDQVLKEKLGDHSLPVSEQEWTEFNTLFQKHKRKRKGMVWFVSLLLLSLIGTGICFLLPDKTTTTQTQSTQETKGNEEAGSGSGQSGLEVHSQSGDNTEAQKQDIPGNQNGSGNVGSSQTGVNQREQIPTQQPSKQEAPDKSKQPGEKPNTEGGNTNGNDVKPRQTDGPAILVPPVVIDPKPALPLLSIKGIPIGFQLPQLVSLPLGRFPIREKIGERIPVLHGPGKTRKKVEQRKLGPSIAFGMVYGFGTPTLSVPEYDTTEIHKNYEKVLNNTPRESEVFRLYAKYEHKLNLAFDITAGLEFSSNVQKQHFDFEQRSIPFLDPNGRIITYITLPNSTPVAPTRFESKQRTYSARVPVSFGYSRFVTSNLRLGARVQSTFGFNWSASSYMGLTPVTLSEEKMSSKTNPFSLGYGGGLFAEYFYLEKWSLRGSFDYTGQNAQYRKNSSYNLNNRFYEFNLAIVRYL